MFHNIMRKSKGFNRLKLKKKTKDSLFVAETQISSPVHVDGHWTQSKFVQSPTQDFTVPEGRFVVYNFIHEINQINNFL